MRKFVAALIVLFLVVGFAVLFTQGPDPVIPAKKVEPEVVKPVEVAPKQAWELAGVPDFPAIGDVRLKKKTFFNYILPLVTQENTRILSQREQLLSLSGKGTFSENEQALLNAVAKEYRLKTSFDEKWFQEALLRVDALPPSLALAQAANESGWGGSRFAREGNNYFGQWCFSKGCGLVPGSRTSGMNHEVQKFDDVGESVRAYIRNLNTHAQYASLRELRANARDSQMTVSGAYLAQGLGKYSERGGEYVDEIVRMINGNNLQRHDSQPTTAKL
ncbi:glucosaminidase domain-containing protein [Parendozoicomonas haliclonae]|uniref:Mannosyl-glycoprotein endo-beta-N-acetylglucosamidase-like domain-containing protein n=1 Tax=Parendozoicomonas haliclonae TaxID=1960125 RepID=A0A1X7AHU7_9GAMM|nr:glucosaminidase domain-containing protein [Parendozoicomonas haliclonae]SMA43669.1 hypothetical protein EHSB41UT_01642 [Parendozoicomonas haliclonae]